jgi:hypothetical protein
LRHAAGGENRLAAVHSGLSHERRASELAR